MDDSTDAERIAKKAHELWESEGRPHGRDREHWDAAKEIVALEESGGVPTLPRDTGAEEPIEERSIAIDNEGEAPNLTDTGEHDLTSIAREPAVTAPSTASKKAAASAKPSPAVGQVSAKSAGAKATSAGSEKAAAKADLGPASSKGKSKGK